MDAIDCHHVGTVKRRICEHLMADPDKSYYTEVFTGHAQESFLLCGPCSDRYPKQTPNLEEVCEDCATNIDESWMSDIEGQPAIAERPSDLVFEHKETTFEGFEEGIAAVEPIVRCGRFETSKGTSVWDISTGERLLEDTGLKPLGYHPGSKQFLSRMGPKRFRLSHIASARKTS